MPSFIKMIGRTIDRSRPDAEQALAWTRKITQPQLRQELSDLISAQRDDEEALPLETVFPEGAKPDFKNQSLDHLLERLELLSSMTVSKAIRR